VDYNSVVKQGQLLAQVDPSILIAQTNESKANVATAKSNLDFQKSNYERQSKLYTLGAISKADYQLALNQYNSAKAAVDNTEAQLHVNSKTLSYTNIYSPVNGVVLNRNISEGQTIASSFSAPTLFVIAKDLTKMRVNAAVDEADIGGILPDQHVSFTVDAFPDDIFYGVVQKILLHAMVSANVVTYTTLINVDNPGLKLKPGMTASINIYIEEDSAALLIPSKSLTFKPDSTLLKKYIIVYARKSSDAANVSQQITRLAPDTVNKIKKMAADEWKHAFVWLKNGDTLTQRRVIIGLNDDTNVKIIKGLSENDEIITSVSAVQSGVQKDVTQKSPFMPTMGGRRPAATPKK
jgi:HlyD family secretion protein